MLTKGIVEKVITPYKVKVRLPVFDGIEGTRNATETNELSEAIVCSLPNSSNLVNIGDIVIIGFEDNDTSKPIILGHLFKENDNNTLVNLKVGALETTGVTKLSKDTHIGEVKPKEIEALSGISSNIQGQIDNLNNQAERLLNNPNLLINSDFRVNQRGQTDYTTPGSTYIYSVDRWKIIGVSLTANDDKSVTLTNFTNYGRLIQPVEFFDYLKGKTVTLSVKFKNVTYTTESDPRLIINDGISNTLSTTIPNGYNGIYTLTKTLDANATALDIRAIHNHLNTTTSDLSVTIEWVKLEIGSIATPFIPRLYVEELEMCQRYYLRMFVRNAYGSFGNFLVRKGNSFGYFYVYPPVELRTKPTMKYSGNFRAYGFGGVVNITSISIDQVSNSVIGIRFDVASAYSAGDAGEISANNDANAYIEFDAEIY